MSDEAKPTAMQKIKSYFDLSLAALVSLVVGVILLALAGIAWLIYSLDATRIAWGDYMTTPRIVGLVGLWVLSVATTYFSVRVWMSDVPVGDRRIREGWKAGMKLLSKHGVALADLPCFVVFGCTNRHEQDLLVGADGHGTIHQSSAGLPAIDWHLSDERIMIFCRDIGVYGSLMQNFDASETFATAGSSTTTQTATPRREASIATDADTKDAEKNAASDDANTESDIDQQANQDASSHANAADTQSDDDPESSDESTLSPELSDTNSSASAPTLTADPVVKSSGTGTDVAARAETITSALTSLDRANALVRDALVADPQAIDATPLISEEVVETPSITSIQATESQALLSQFCTRLRASRFPHSAINGALVVVDAAVVAASNQSARTVGRAIRSDLDQLRVELGVSSPVTMLVAEKEHADDFAELGRRLRIIGQDQDIALGKEFESAELPTVAAMNQLAGDSVRQIQHRIHQIFHTPRSLAQPQNHRLVRVLIQCRRWSDALRALMVESCASAETSHESASDAPIVSGLYIAPAGKSSHAASSQKSSMLTAGFIRAVLDRMVDQQNHLAWTSKERQRGAKHQWTVNLLRMLTLVLAIAFALQLWISMSR
tara:strand:+ start:20779 stop:22608 length:1830 start_codon:yes stop_codon:yes gene_type:complete